MPASSHFLAEETRSLLHTARFGRVLEAHATLPSTNARATAWAAEGAEEGSIVLAEEQTAGRGRHGRTWTSHPGKNLTFSIILRPALSADRLGLVILAACVAVCEVVEDVTAPISPAVKWPNDLLLDGRKCCGMLLESSFAGCSRSTPAVVLGVGMNVNQHTFPPELVSSPTSLLLETGRLIPRAPLLARLLERFEVQYDTLSEDGGRTARRAYEARLSGIGEPTTLRFAGTDRIVHGRLHGITHDGALQLDTDAGRQTFHAGEVTTR